MDKRSLGFLVVALFIGILTGSLIGECLGVVFDYLGLQNNVVQKVLVDPLYEYEFYPMRLNFIVVSLTFGFSIDVNVLALLGIAASWYYVKYSY